MTEIYQQNKKLIRTVVFVYFRNVPEYVASFSELFNIGFIGLVDAVKRYDHTRGNFRPYAVCRIRGEIQDYLERSWRHHGNGPPVAHSYEPNTDRNEMRWILAECIEQLPEKHRKLILEHCFNETTLRVLGRRNRRCETTMSVQMKKIRKELQRQLALRGVHSAADLSDHINESEGHHG